MIQAGYALRVSVFTAPSATENIVIGADARRFYLRFEAPQMVVINQPLLPFPKPTAWTDTNVPGFPYEVKWKDRPVACISEWYCTIGVGNKLLITEELDLGR